MTEFVIKGFITGYETKKRAKVYGCFKDRKECYEYLNSLNKINYPSNFGRNLKLWVEEKRV